MYIVTGGAGLIGSAVIWKLNSLGIDDILVVDNLGSTEKWKNLVNRRFELYMHRDDFIKAVAEQSLEMNVTAVIHMGACSSTTESDVDFLFQNNLEYSKILCSFALEKRARFINASSAATYGDGTQGFDDNMEQLDALRPLNAYGYSKHLFDVWARRNELFDRIASLKFFNVYGPNEYHKGTMRSVVNKAFEQIRTDDNMTLFRSDVPDYADGGQLRDFIYVKDCAEIIWWLVENPMVNGLFNIGTGAARTWNDLAAAVFAAMERPVNIDYVDMPESLKGKYQNYTEALMGRLRAAGYTAPMYSLEQGVTDYVRYYLQGPDPYL